MRCFINLYRFKCFGMKFEKALKGRRSIRKYKDKKLSKNALSSILDAARYAPCAGGMQNFRLIVVEDKKKKSIAILYDNGEIYGAFTFKKPKPPTFLEYILDDLKLFFKELIDGPQERYSPTSFE